MPELGPQTVRDGQRLLRRDGEPQPGSARRRGEARDRRRRSRRARPPATCSSPGSSRRTPARSAIATSRGLFAYHRSERRGSRRPPRARPTAPAPAGRAPARATGARSTRRRSAASRRRRRSRAAIPKAIEPGLYTVVLEPQAVADLIPQLVGAFNARANDEGRGTFSKPGGGTKLGEKIADERVTIYSDPTDPRAARAAVRGRRHCRSSRIVYIENGILKNFSYDRFWAQKQGKTADRRRWRWRWRRWWRRWRRRRRRRPQVRRRHEDARTS